MQRCSLGRAIEPVARQIKPQYHISRRRSYSSTSSATPTEFYDIACVGGGPAGLSLASALRSNKATAGLKIALIESQDLSKTQRLSSPTAYSNRCSSLTPSSVKFLNEIGAWHHIDRSRIQPYDSMHVWDGVTGSHITFDWPSTSTFSSRTPSPTPSPTPTSATSTPQTDRTIAYMTENSNLTTALLSRIRELGSVTILDKTRVEDISLGTETETTDLRSWPLVTLSNGQTLAARLLVGADGGNSPVRTFAGIESKGWDYERHGVVATLRLDPEHTQEANSNYEHAIAYQRFLPTGPAALLPMPNGFATLVWSTLPAHAAHLKTLSGEDFVAMVNAAFRLSMVDLRYMHTVASGQADELSWRVQHTPFDRGLVPPMVQSVQEGSIASFPLKMRHADTYTGERVALVGDAAHTVHPLAGQGLNLGQADVAALASVIEDAVVSGQDIGSTLALEAYNAKRYAANHVMLGACDKLHKLYAWESGPVVAARSLGLSAVNAMGWVKGALMRGAAGA